MSYFLFEEIGDSDTILEKELFNDTGDVNIVDIDNAAESSCCNSFDHNNTPKQRGTKNKIISKSDKYYQEEEDDDDDDDEADSCSSKVMNNVNGSARKKLKSNVSESFVMSTSSRTGVVNMNEITDDKLFWDLCLAHGYP